VVKAVDTWLERREIEHSGGGQREQVVRDVLSEAATAAKLRRLLDNFVMGAAHRGALGSRDGRLGAGQRELSVQGSAVSGSG